MSDERGDTAMKKTPATQDDAIEAAFVAGTLPEQDRRADDRRAPDAAPTPEPEPEPRIDGGAGVGIVFPIS